MNTFQTTLTPNPAKLYNHYSVTKQSEACLFNVFFMQMLFKFRCWSSGNRPSEVTNIAAHCFCSPSMHRSLRQTTHRGSSLLNFDAPRTSTHKPLRLIDFSTSIHLRFRQTISASAARWRQGAAWCHVERLARNIRETVKRAGLACTDMCLNTDALSVCEQLFLSGEPLPRSPAASAALQPPIRRFESFSTHMSSSPEDSFLQLPGISV